MKTRKKAFEVGKRYFIRTVTYHLIGQLEAIDGKFLLLSNASWVADSGRFMQAIKEGRLSEVEPVGEAIKRMVFVAHAMRRIVKKWWGK